jgi:cytochrome c oxidase subunit 2
MWAVPRITPYHTNTPDPDISEVPLRLRRAPRPSLRSLLIGLLVVTAAAGCASQVGEPGLFPTTPVSEQGEHINNLYNVVFWVAAAIFIFVEALILIAVLRYRRRSDVLPKQTHGNLLLELTWVAIPAVIVVALFVLSMDTLGKVEAKSDGPAVTVDATGFQWQWTFDYKAEGLKFTGQGTQGPEMVVPVGEPVRVNLYAQDVIHAFYVPTLLYKKDVVPGRVNSFDVRIDEPGTYTGQCAEFCGLQHADMFFTMRAVPRGEYDAWVTAEQEKANATPEPAPSGAAIVTMSAQNAVSFDQVLVEAAADQPFTIEFVNNDPAAPHNVAIREATPEGDFVGMPIANAGETVNYNVPALPTGDYQYFCSVHPNMQGTLTVKP